VAVIEQDLELERILQKLYAASIVVRIAEQLMKKTDEAKLLVFDLSDAFDTVDHVTLLRRLELSYGISGTAHAWFVSYLDNMFAAVLLPCCLVSHKRWS